MKELFEIIDNLIVYANKNLLLDRQDMVYKRNRLLDILGIETFEGDFDFNKNVDSLEKLLKDFVDYAIKNGVFEDFESEKYLDRVMGELSLLPSTLNKEFDKMVKVDSKNATDFLYDYCVKNNYVKKSALDKNPKFVGDNGLVITINKAKPEFRDPKKAASGNSVKGGFPKCVICCENEGFGVRNKGNLRKVDLTLNGENFFWQYSPYGYFNEHGIAVNYEHIPMHIDRDTFCNLMDFVDTFPHYFIGCNACLPRIGGSVLAHDHYQGGGEILPLQKAKIKVDLSTTKYPDIKIGILDWPGSAIRIVGKNKKTLIDFCEKLRGVWVEYDNKELGIISKDDDGQHSSISPTVIKNGELYEFSIILRNNITTKEYPDGLFHAHPEFHIIKKESIGLIEAQGLFILPGRLETQLQDIENLIVENKELSEEYKDFEFIYGEIKSSLNGKTDRVSVNKAIKDELASVCYRILQNTAVFKDIKDFVAFVKEKVL